jgi:hypothetical protein
MSFEFQWCHRLSFDEILRYESLLCMNASSIYSLCVFAATSRVLHILACKPLRRGQGLLMQVRCIVEGSVQRATGSEQTVCTYHERKG